MAVYKAALWCAYLISCSVLTDGSKSKSAADSADVTPTSMAPLSVNAPAKAGYASVTRQGKDMPLEDLLCYADGRKVYPTNHWWVPAVRPSSSIGKQLLVQLPYIYNLVSGGMEVYYPYVKGMANIAQNMLNQMGASWVVGAADVDAFCVKASDEMSATFKWGDKMESTILRGSPYVTARYRAATVQINSPLGIGQKISVDGKESECSGTVTGSVFTVQLSGDEEWMVFTPPSTALICSPAGLSVEGSFTGTIRLALSNNCTTGIGAGPDSHCGPWSAKSEQAEWVEALQKGSNTCTRGTDLAISDTLTGIETTITFKNQPCWGSTESGQMMMTALPHHISILDSSSKIVAGGGHRNVRGHAKGVLTSGDTWVLVYSAQPLDWIGSPSHDKVPMLLKTLKGMGSGSDMNYDLNKWAAAGMIDPYNGGKLIAKICSLILIADSLGEKDIVQKLLKRAQGHLSTWLDQRSGNRLVYDKNWGGVISCGCTYIWNDVKKFAYCANNGSKLECPTLQDGGYDFGNSIYNDHHFHYGYFIYSAAVVAKFDPKWVQKYNEKVLALVRDIANPSSQDPYFTPFRMFDWYVGHSWALGITADANGRNQESSSEAVNAWYGMYLYGQATKNKKLKTLGNALLLGESHSTNYYWHVKASNDIYPKEYEHNIVGIMHEMLVEFQTFFGLRSFFVHGIQLIPITPMVRIMFEPDWVATAYPNFRDGCMADEQCAESGFITFLFAEQALIDKEGAWTNALTLSDHVFSDECPGGNGNSRTALLHFIASYGNKKRSGTAALEVVSSRKQVLELAAVDPPQSAPATELLDTAAEPKQRSNAFVVVGGCLTFVVALGLALNALMIQAFKTGEEKEVLLSPEQALELGLTQHVPSDGYGTQAYD